VDCACLGLCGDRLCGITGGDGLTIEALGDNLL
jgi:hypothetical protein